MRRRTLLGGLAALAAAGCTAPVATAPSSGPTTATRPDPLLADPPADIWPAAYRAAPEATREAYRYAVAEPDILRWFPCFCGCVADGHESNIDCFVRTRLAGGRVILDAHGFG